MAIQFIRRIDDPRLMLGVIEVRGGAVHEASTALQERAAALAQKLGADGYAIPEQARVAVRQVLKSGGFSPTGRNRPAQELLLNDLQERGGFHHINNVVDVNNVFSLETLLPISIFDAAKLSAPIIMRIATEGEGYVFNQSGQYMDVKRSIICCHSPQDAGPEGAPIGSPVKDCLATKIYDGASHYVGVIYGTTELYSTYQMVGLTNRFANMLAEETGGFVVQAVLV
jgi:DNA/RNA-binding domain of Phe-tRNA-synthetase-like protein